MELMTTLEKLKYFSDEHKKMIQAQELMQKKAVNLDKDWQEFVGTLGLPEGQVHLADVCKAFLEKNIETSLIIKP